LVEYPAGSKDNISGVKVKNGTALKDSGMTTTIGAIRKKKMHPQIIRNV